MKRFITFICILGLVITFAGCGGGGGGGGTTNPEIESAIEAKIVSFKNAVQAYNVEGMLAFLDKNDFKLTISEQGSTPYTKEYAVLKNELEEDEEKQLHWRDPIPQGHGYVLTMEIGTITYSNLSSSGAYVTVSFVIKEKADEPPISETITDTGNMVCEMVNLQGEWRCRRMTINYDNIGGIQLSSKIFALGARVGERSETTGGFGFGKVYLGK